MDTPLQGEDGKAGVGTVLLTLAAGQFLMTLDSSVMNVSMATVANDLDTTITGIQTAITLYTLVMASLMITGGKIGAKIGRKRAFAIGCVIYGAGSFTTSIAQSLPVLLFGWSLLEGIGAALIMPAIVALVASNFPLSGRPKAFGTVAAAGAVAVAIGPLLGGLATTYFSWRWVFAGEVIIVIAILAMSRSFSDPPPEESPPLDYLGAVLTASGLGLAVYGVLRSSTWGWIMPKPNGKELLGLSPVIWLILAGILILWVFVQWEMRLESSGKSPLISPSMFRNRQLTGGLMLFGCQFLVQAGVFFIVPLFLSVVLELSALETGIRLLPLSMTLLIAALGIPRFFPNISPRRVVQMGLLLLTAGAAVLLAGVDLGASAAVVTVPMLLMGLGIGALASQLGAITVSSEPESRSSEVGGLQNTASNLGASLGTALAGSILIASMTAAFIGNVQNNPSVPDEIKGNASVELAGGIPFISSADLENWLEEGGVDPDESASIVDDYDDAQMIGLRSALAMLTVLSLAGLFVTNRIPNHQPGHQADPANVA